MKCWRDLGDFKRLKAKMSGNPIWIGKMRIHSHHAPDNTVTSKHIHTIIGAAIQKETRKYKAQLDRMNVAINANNPVPTIEATNTNTSQYVLSAVIENNQQPKASQVSAKMRAISTTITQ